MPDLKKNIKVRAALADDSSDIAEIYNYYIRETIVTFEEHPVSPAEIKNRIQAVHGLALPWLIAILNDRISGYAYANRWRERTAYRFAVEVTVYVHPDFQRHGIGFRLYDALMHALKAKGVHTALGVIALPNDASIGLHERFGFRKVSHLKEMGYKFKQWIDVGYWQRLL